MAPSVPILLVDDNPDDVALAIRALRRARLGNRIEVVWDGAEALEVLCGPGIEGARPWLVLLDLHLPKVDGLEVLRYLRADPRTQALPVIILTASADQRARVEQSGVAVQGYLIKPVDFAKLVQAVEAVGFSWRLTDRL